MRKKVAERKEEGGREGLRFNDRGLGWVLGRVCGFRRRTWCLAVEQDNIKIIGFSLT